MITYDIYEVTFHGKKYDHELTTKEIYSLVTNNGEWDNVECDFSESYAKRMWNNKWRKQAYTEIDPWDSDFVDYVIYVFEKTMRDDNEEPVESYEIDYSVELLR